MWTDLEPHSEPERVLAARLEELLAGTLSKNGSGVRVRPDADMLAGLSRGAELLAELLPHAGAGVTLFHEGLHLKLFDILRTGSMAADPDQLIPIPWRVKSWTLTRVLFAMHVYAHLLLFRAAATGAGPDLCARYGEPPATDFVDQATPGSQAAGSGEYTTTVERVTYLAQQASQTYGGMLTASGRRFVDWLIGAVAPLAPGILPESPPVEARPRTEVELAVRGYRQAQPVQVCPIPEQRELVAVTPGAPSFQWLNEHAWLIYALCDGRDLSSLRDRYRQAAEPGTDDQLGLGVADLLSVGLIVPV